MKKLYILSAVAAACAATGANAADVTLYGRINTSLNYSHAEIGDTTTDHLTMGSGNNSANRIGLEGSETLDNGVTVGFTLEGQYASDSGALQQSGTLFGRESTLFVRSGLGELRMGKMGAVRSAVSNARRFGGDISPLSVGWGNTYIQAHSFVNSASPVRPANAVLYTTPNFAGFDLTLQYSLANNDEGPTADSDDRYMAGVLRYKNGALNTELLVDTTNLSEKTDGNQPDPFSVGWALNYDFTSFKLWGIAQYFQDSKLNNPTGFVDAAAAYEKNGITSKGTYDGYGLTLALSAPVAGGTVKTAVGYMDASDAEDKTGDVTRYNVALAYEYPLSNRTTVYSGVGYVHQKVDNASNLDAKGFEWETGLLHFF